MDYREREDFRHPLLVSAVRRARVRRRIVRGRQGRASARWRTVTVRVTDRGMAGHIVGSVRGIKVELVSRGVAARSLRAHQRVFGGSARARVVLALGSIAVTSIALSVTLLFLLVSVAGAVGQMRSDERSIHEGLMLGVAVREQYIHEAHTLIETDRTHLEHHHTWVERVAENASDLRDRVPPSQRWRLARIARTSQQIDARFRALLPAVERGDSAAVIEGHRRIDELVTRAAADADAVAEALERRMADAHVGAERTARIGIGLAAGGALLVLLLAGLSSLRLAARVIRPMGRLVEATRAIGRGEEPTNGIDGDDEVRAVGEALTHLARELRAREARLVASERMAVVGQLAAGVAHEINNPIAIIRGYLRTMIPDAEGELRRELSILDEEAAACARLTEDLVAFARSGELRKTPIEIDTLVGETVDRLQTSGTLGAATLRLEVEPARLQADRQRLRQVLTNLLRNAVQACPNGDIEIVGRSAAHAYELEVRDRGPGVPELDRPRVFEPFVSKRAEGSGLGLAVCLAVVRAHGGQIEIADRDGGGAVFRVALPRSEELP